MLVVIDNYDSFTWNLVQYLCELGAEVRVFRNDAISVAEIRTLAPRALLLSPGPCTPNEAGICLAAIADLAGRIPILGVCLGHQAIGQAFGGRVVRAARVMHGKVSEIRHGGRGLFARIESPMIATRYHSLLVERSSLPPCLQITAETAEGEIMAFEHEALPVWGVQFHPESIMTPRGKDLLKNFLRLAEAA